MIRIDGVTKRHTQKALELLIGLAIGLALGLALEMAIATRVSAAAAARFESLMNVPVGSDVELPIQGMKRFIIGAPNIVGATRSESGLRVSGKRLGTTVLIVRTDKGFSSYQVQVVAQSPPAEELSSSALEIVVAAAPETRSTVNRLERFAGVLAVSVGAETQLPIAGVRRFTIGAPNILSARKTDLGLTLTGKAPGTTVLVVRVDDGFKSYKTQVAAQPQKAETASIAAPVEQVPAQTKQQQEERTQGAELPQEQVAAQPRQVKAVAIAAVPRKQVVTAAAKPKAPAAESSSVADPPVAAPTLVALEPGESSLLKGSCITRTSVSEPGVVNIVPVSTSEILVNAIKEGKATIRVWDAKGLATYAVAVAKQSPSPEEIAAAITQQIGMPTIGARMTGDTIILTGVAQTMDVAQKAASVAEASGKKVLNLVTVESVSAETLIASFKIALPSDPLTYETLPDQTVMIKGTVPTHEDAYRIRQVVDGWIGTPEPASSDKSGYGGKISFVGKEETPADVIEKARVDARPLQETPGGAEVGEQFNVARQVFGGRIANGPRVLAIIEVNPALSKQLLISAQVIEVDRSKLKRLGIQWSEILGKDASDSALIISEGRTGTVRLGDGGPVVRSTLSSSIQALITDGAGRVLSEPKVLITDGHAAHILVGGEIPIPVAQNTNIGTASVSVVFKPFGIQLTVRPKITPDNRIMLTLTPEVSDVDWINKITAGGIEIPTFTVRRTTTTVHVANGEALAIGGLLSSKDIKTVERVPLLSKIPVLGELFKSRSFRKEQTELIILVTPQIVERGAAVPIAAPAS